MTIVGGADGCKSGWVLAVKNTKSDEIECSIVGTVKEAFDRYPRLEVLAIDVPIGIPDSGSRACDLAARKVLGAMRGRSVFPAPIRAMLEADCHQIACRYGRAIDGRGITIQCWSILPKIKEVDCFIRRNREFRERIREVHPEVCFWALAGRPMRHQKKKPEGRSERRELLESIYGETVIPETDAFRDKGAQADDVLDAFVALWSALRIHREAAIALPEAARFDSFGLKMQILA